MFIVFLAVLKFLLFSFSVSNSLRILHGLMFVFDSRATWPLVMHGVRPLIALHHSRKRKNVGFLHHIAVDWSSFLAARIGLIPVILWGLSVCSCPFLRKLKSVFPPARLFPFLCDEFVLGRHL